MKELFLFILLLGFGFLSRGQTGTPTSSDILTIYVPKSSIDRSISLRLVDQKTFTNTNFLSYRSGSMSYECVYQGYRNDGTRRVSNSVRSISCGRYNSYYRRPTTITIPYSNTETVVAYEYEVSGHRRVTESQSGSDFEICSPPEILGLTDYAHAPDIYIGHIVYLTSGFTYSGSCSGEWVAGSKTPSEYTAIRAYSYPFASKGDKHVTLGTSGGSLNLKSTTYWNRTSLPINYGNMTFKVGVREGDNRYGQFVMNSVGVVNLHRLYDLLPANANGDADRSVTVTATLPYYNGSTGVASFVLTLRGTPFVSRGNKTVCASGTINLKTNTYFSRVSPFIPSNAVVSFRFSNSNASRALNGTTLNLASLYDLLSGSGEDRTVTVTARLVHSGNVRYVEWASFLLTLQGVAPFSISNNFLNNVVNNQQVFCKNSGNQVISTLSDVIWSGSYVSNNQFNTDRAPNGTYTLTATRRRSGCSAVSRTATTNVSVITPSVNLSSGNVLKYCDYNSDVNLGSIVVTPGGGSFSYPRNSANKSLVVSNGEIRISSTGAGTYPIVYTKEINGCIGSARQDIVINPRPAIPSIVNVANHERCGPGSITLAVSHPESGNYIWISSVGSPIGGFTDNTYEQDYINTTARKVIFKKTSTSCQSLEKSLEAKVKPIPTAPTLSQTNSVCGVNNATMSVEDPVAGYIYKWYNTINSLSSVSEGVTYTPNISATSTFYVEAVSSEGCVSSGRTQVVGVVNPIPDVPIVRDSIRCGPGEVELRAFHNDEGHFIWYETDVSTTEISGSEAYTTPKLNTTRSYFVKFVDEKGCDSERVEVVVTII